MLYPGVERSETPGRLATSVQSPGGARSIQRCPLPGISPLRGSHSSFRHVPWGFAALHPRLRAPNRIDRSITISFQTLKDLESVAGREEFQNGKAIGFR